MPARCSVRGCRNTYRRKFQQDSLICFHRFPLKLPNLLKLWLSSIRQRKFKPTKSSLICSVHFEESCFIIEKRREREVKLLKFNSVPTLFLGEADSADENESDSSLPEFEDQNSAIPELDADCNVEKEVVHDLQENNRSEETFYQLIDVSMESVDAPSLSEITKNVPPDSFEEHSDESDHELLNLSSLEKSISAAKNKLTSKIVKRALKKALLESEIKAANARRTYFENKKSLLHQSKPGASEVSVPFSLNDLKVLEDLEIQVMEEELASTIEKKVLQRQLLEAEIKAALSKQNYYATKKSALTIFNCDS